jgi:hypothetical protein
MLRALGLASLVLAAATRLAAQDQTVTGNLTVTKNTTISGDVEAGNISGAYNTKEPGAGGNWIHFGLDVGDIFYKPSSTTYLFPGYNISAENGNVSLLPTNVTFTGYSPNTTWTWQQNLYNSGGFNGTNITLQMQLTDQGVLTLNSTYYNTPSNITLDPGNQSIVFSNGLTIQRTSSTLVLGLGSEGFAVGSNVTANGTGAFALGNNATANATGAFALGRNVTTNALNSVVLGHYDNYANITGNATTWVSTDPALIVGIGQNSSATANGLVVLNNGIVYSGAGNQTYDSGTGLPQGVGNRLMWIPQKNSFFAGGPGDNGYGNLVTQWNYGNIGIGVVALGDNISVAGNGSVVIGMTSRTQAASGYADGSIALGSYDFATGQGAIALGLGASADLNNTNEYYTIAAGAVSLGYQIRSHGSGAVAAGYYSVAAYDGAVAIGNWAGAGGSVYGNSSTSTGAVAIGESSGAIGNGSVALGLNNNSANGTGAVALGNDNIPVGSGAVAIGNTNAATGNSTIAIGSNVTVTGNGSAALGSNLTVSAANALVGGQWASNVNSTSNIVFAIGNGNSTTQSNAITVLKNGNTTISGDAAVGGNTTVTGNLTVNGTLAGNVTLNAAQGDIPMGPYGY